MSLIWVNDPEDVWAYFQTPGLDESEVRLPVELADAICEYCRYLIPDTPALCCWWCTWDLTASQDEEYCQLLLAFEAQVLATLDVHTEA